MREPATTGMHGNIWVGTSHHGNARERWMEHPYNDVQCVFSRSSACHTKYTKPPNKLVVHLFNCLRDYSRNLAAVKNRKTKADEIVPELRLEKPITWSRPDYLKTAGTTFICYTKKTILPATTHTTRAYRAKPHDAVPPARYTIFANSTSVQKQ